MKEESTVEYTDANGNKMQKIVKGWNEPAVLAAWQNYVGAKAKSYSKYPNQAKALWDTVLEQGRNILTTDKQGNPTQTYSDGYALSASDGTPGTALTAIDTGVFAESMLSYAGNFMPPEGEIVSKSKVIKPEKGSDDDKQVDVSYIDKIKIDAIGTGPTEEGRPLFNLSEVEVQLAPYGFRVSGPEVIVGGRQGRTLTKSTPGGDRSVNVFENLTEDKLRDLLKFIDTGDNKYLQDIQAEPVDYKGIDLLTMPGQ